MVEDAFATKNNLKTQKTSKKVATFQSEVKNFFADNEIYCSDNVQFTGASGFMHTYDFLLQRTRTKPERLCKAINTPRKDYIMNALFAWGDTKSTRQPDSKLIVLINDSHRLDAGLEEACSQYDTSFIPWSQRKEADKFTLLSAS